MSRYEDPNEKPWAQRAAKAVPTDLLRDIVADSRRGPTAPSSMISKPEAQAAPAIGKRGWIDAVPLPSSPPGMRIIDRMMDQQDRMDRADLERKLKPK
jgi:hypothetical protein